jgi:hypothetical protein
MQNSIKSNSIPALVFLAALLLPCRAEDGVFKIHDGRFWDPDGKEWIGKGANVQGYNQCWEYPAHEHIDKFIDCWKFNFARVYARIYPTNCTWPQHTLQEMHESIDAYTARKVVCMVELHDRTGSYFEGSALQDAIDFWKALATKYTDNPYVWYNCMNEPGSSNPSQSRWLACHRAIIKAIRSTGNEHPIICDAEYWGQDGGSPSRSTLLKYGDQVWTIDGKKYDNIGFSVHTWEQWRGTSALGFKTYFSKFHEKGMAIMVGEYGSYRNGKDIMTIQRAMMQAAQQLRISRNVWSWFGGNDCKLVTTGPSRTETDGWRGWTINDCDNPTNLTALGGLTWADNHREEEDVWLPGYPKHPVSAGMRPERIHPAGHSSLTGMFAWEQLTVLGLDGSVGRPGKHGDLPTGAYIIRSLCDKPAHGSVLSVLK